MKHTKSFTNKYFNEHPHKYDLYGLSKMLSDYGVKTIAVKVEDKENNLFNIELPFIAYVGGDFVVVYKINGDNVSYLRNGKKITIPVSQFIQTWSGVTLLAAVSPDSIEPNYAKNRKKELLPIVQKAVVAIVGILIFGLVYISQALFTDLGISLLLFVNLTGIYIGCLLLLKQMRIHSQYADKICSLFSKRDCNNVLESPAAKLWNTFSWSEIGLGYFTANVLLLLFFPQTVSVITILNIFTLPYAFWSIWYQKTKAQQWCSLCLIALVQLWSIFAISLIFGYIQFSELKLIDLSDILLVGSVYAAITLGFTLLNKGVEIKAVQQEMNSIKANEKVFNTLLALQPFHEVSKADSQIIFGNPDADLKITIFTNLFCNPCAAMHKRVKKFLLETNDDACVQYIFASFHSNFNFAEKYIVAAYLQKKPNEFEQIIAEWFERGKAQGEAFFKKYQLDIEDLQIEVEFLKHKAWTEKSQLRATPTILVNGYKLPDNYKIEDLKHFVKTKV